MKRIRRLLLALLMIALIISAVYGCMKLQHIPGLLEQASLPLTCIRGIRAADSWTDWLAYTDGYDYAVLQVDPNTFAPPEGWETGLASAKEITSAPEGLGCCRLSSNFYRDAPLPESFTAWRFDPRDTSLPFDGQQFFAAMYDAATGTLVLYRGHSFYGSPII